MSLFLGLQRLRPVTATVEQTFTRPANTTTYAAGDVVNASATAGAMITFPACVRENGLGAVLQSVQLVCSTSPTLLGDFDLMLFDTNITPNNDNDQFAPTDAHARRCIACVPLRAAVTSYRTPNNVIYDSGAIAQSVRALATSRDLFGALVARNAYVPGNAEEFFIRLMLLQD